MPDKFSMNSSRNFSRDQKVADAVMSAVSTYDPEMRAQGFKKALSVVADQASWFSVMKFMQNYIVANDLIYDPPADGMPRLFATRWK